MDEINHMEKKRTLFSQSIRNENYNNIISSFFKTIKLIKSRISRAFVFTLATFTGIFINLETTVPIAIIFMGLVSTFFMSLAVYLVNDLVDYKIDLLNAPNRPIISEHAYKEAFILILFFNILGLTISYLINLQALVTNLLVLSLGILYSAPLISLKDRFILKTCSIGLGGTLAIIFGSVAVSAINLRVIYVTIIFFLFIFISSPINDLADYSGDIEYGRRTIPIILGPKKTIYFTIFLSVYILIFNSIFYSFVSFNILEPLFIGIICVTTIYFLYRILQNYNDFKNIRKRHKSIVFLHFLLQVSFIIGSM